MSIRHLVLAIVFLLTTSAFSFTTESRSNGLHDLHLQLKFDSREVILGSTTADGRQFTKFEIPNEGMNAAYAGQPDIPRLHRWFAVNPHAKYEIETNFSNPMVFKNILLYPSQPDPADIGIPAPFTYSAKAYAKNKWYGGEQAVMQAKKQLGGATILPVTIFPAKYNPVKRELIVYRDIDVRVKSLDTEATVPANISPFLEEQLSLLTVNGNDYLRDSAAQRVPNKLLIITSSDLSGPANELADIIRTESGAAVTLATIAAVPTSDQIKKAIQSHAGGNVISHVLFFGNESRIPLYQLSGIYGDAWYSFINGMDEIADIGLGRVPVSGMDEAKQFVNKTRAYYSMKKKGANKRVMLIAHREQYPGKYTGNMEQVRKAANPLGLQYNTQYGGENATTGTVLQEAQKEYSILNYRGHGGSSTWASWGRDSASFGLSHVEQLPNTDTSISFIFNIACHNGAIQGSQQSLAEKQMFPTKDANQLKGAIATIGATEASSTETNHRFNSYLFQFLQDSTNKEIGNVYALANNRVMKDSGGSVVKNVRMYLLLADPTLAPNI